MSNELTSGSSPVPIEGTTDVEQYRDLATDLRKTIDGEVRFDEYTQLLYATDGSIYQARPAGVVLPTSVSDVQEAVRIATKHDVPVLPRGAGSSLAGQAVGPGCIVLDFSKYMDRIRSIDPNARRVTVEPGVVQDDLDAALNEYGLKFAPDPASSNRATIGGSIGNNSTGAHSIRYGITDAYTEELDVVLADGTLIHTREIVLDGPDWESIVEGDDTEAHLYTAVRRIVEENEAEIESRYPALKRNVSGYNLDRVIYKNDDGEEVVNLSRLIVGSEGTLGVVVQATLSLVTTPDETALVVYCFDDLIDAMAAVPEALNFDVSAVELMDAELVRLARESGEFAEYAEPIPAGTGAALMLEFDSELHDDFERAIVSTNEHFLNSGDAFEHIEAYEASDQADLWKLRKAGIPLLMSLEGDPKPYPFIEDATVPPEKLADYVQEFEAVLDDHGTSATYFAHAGAGTLHIRPILNLKTDDGIQTMLSIADDVTDIVLEYNGSFSGEHGDGLARTQFTPKMYGETLWEAFKAVKTAFDPDWLMNPGKVVFRKNSPTDMRENLRYGPAYSTIEATSTLDFSDEGGYGHLIELCNGCGTCRQTDSDTMCPTYRATKDELMTTRGRANLLRGAISGELSEDELYSREFQEAVLDYCIGCKGCMNDCPTGVDLAKLKAETKYRYRQREGSTFRDRLFSNIDRASALGSTFAPLSNVLPSIPGSRWAMERLLGIASERSLPTFSRRTFDDLFEAFESSQSPDEADHRVVFVPDTFTKYVYPDVGIAAVRVLDALGVYVTVDDSIAESGRAAYSMGFLDQAKTRAKRNVEAIRPYVEDGWSIVFVEPSDVVMYQDEYLDLLDDDFVATLAGEAYGVCEFIDTYRLDETVEWQPPSESLIYHGHCNQKAMNTAFHTGTLLERIGYETDVLDSGCCGMAGSFGYEAEHYDLSQAIGDILFDQIRDSPGESVVAPGASCRTQIGDRPGATTPAHPIEKLESALVLP